ncbi:LamB/YcsF family protein [Calorimonas adulescens]|uniref:5-oxoprolinase subunit A n=1 Tax=Calorimonas adulescens TaxID=2606906 RepID=A0A5D8QDZ9_9THEO|nr:5-oxoprolinase subunit PxpA [Calorimonas adulescens]TZE82404.1 5-oxoprolinase subunit PxpA [Calorimonas adulescens]
MTFSVDLNSDVGESFGVYRIGMDREVLNYVTSANIACGYHAGDPLVMEKTVEMAVKNMVAIGAHPGYPDIMGFGRRELNVTPEEVKAYVKYQIGALYAFAVSKGVKLQHVKAHGAMYNMAVTDYGLAKAIAEAISEVDKDLIILAMAGSQMIEAARDAGIKAASEFFADRAYNDDGTLVSRGIPGSTIEDEELALERVIEAVEEGRVETITGRSISLKVDSICVHGDNPKALRLVKKIREGLEKNGINVVPLSRLHL